MIYRLQDKYDYKLPDPPKLSEILFHEEKTANQYWRRELVDFEEANKKWTDSQKMKFVQREINRRINGVHFMNNGKLEYITGSNYFFLDYFLVPIPEEEGIDFSSDDFKNFTQLVWDITEDGMMFPQYRVYQKEFFYFLDLTAKERRCEGGAVTKPRRVGITACFNADVLNQATIKYQKKFSLMNKDLKDAIEVNYEPIKYNIQHFPSLKLSNGKEILRPQHSKLLTKKTKFVAESDDEEGRKQELNNHIYVCTTVENANDGTGTFRLIRDEASKYPPNIDISTMLEILRPVARVGTRQVGKIYYFCTSAEKDTANFQRWKTIYFDADPSFSSDGRTSNGLYNYAVSGKYAIEGTVLDENGQEVELFDKYGNCKEHLALKWIENEMRPYRLKGDMQGLQSKRRQYPITERDSFDSVTQTSCYDTVRLLTQLYDIEAREKRVFEALEKPFYTDGDLEWERDGNGNVLRDQKVRFVPKENGGWRIFELPNERWENKNYKDRYGYLTTDDHSPYLLTCDPTAYREAISGGSKPAIVIGSSLDSSLPNGGQSIACRYLKRTQNPNDVIENFRMGIIFYAAKGFPETNKEWVAMDLIKGRDDEQNSRPNYGRCLLTWDKSINGFRQWKYGEQKIVGLYTGANTIEAYVKDTATYLREPRGLGEIDRLKNIWDKVLINQWMNFDPSETTKFDLAVTASMWCMLLKNYNKKIVVSENKLSDRALIRSWYGIKEKQLPVTR